MRNIKTKLLREDLYLQSTKEYISKIRCKQNIIIWGCASQNVYRFLKEHSLDDHIKYYADNNNQKWGKQLEAVRFCLQRK